MEIKNMNKEEKEVERQKRCIVICEKCQGAFPLWNIGCIHIPQLDTLDFNCPVCKTPTSSKEFELHRDDLEYMNRLQKNLDD